MPAANRRARIGRRRRIRVNQCARWGVISGHTLKIRLENHLSQAVIHLDESLRFKITDRTQTHAFKVSNERLVTLNLAVLKKRHANGAGSGSGRNRACVNGNKVTIRVCIAGISECKFRINTGRDTGSHRKLNLLVLSYCFFHGRDTVLRSTVTILNNGAC